MSAADTLRKFTAGRPGWSLDYENAPTYAFADHKPSFVVVVLSYDVDVGAWVCRYGRRTSWSSDDYILRLPAAAGRSPEDAMLAAIRQAAGPKAPCPEVAALAKAVES